MTWRAHGSGLPVTLVAPGLGATQGEARIPASGLAGTRVVLTLPSHGDAPDAPDGYWTYPTIAADLAEVADRVEATRAVGVSLGSGALTRLLAEQGDRFDRVALLLPAALDRPRSTPAVWALERMADAVDAHDLAGLRELVAGELPPGVPVGDYVEARTAALTRLAAALRTLPEQSPLTDAAALADVRTPVLVIAATGDPLHPEEVARATARALPAARFEALPSPAPLITHRREVRALLTGFLDGA
ncbi:alpha/beta fold hydrolase [Solihabitans fulvus]|uniref:Alpha/beta fold hydrolase n=1 Tax=Solihabitans fulvus TaxID=1892852 RepID=A0A5B2XPT0_9PSEU|nr:alpha/beta fold hydrolase [Solihabitans fulvus]